ncbi:hypothetical protein BC829DRAFT_112343 [Chytridium lagenaria]|nr:hypothetical protein BC829DRAFT_112343 [Chytridium lagenaria]
MRSSIADDQGSLEPSVLCRLSLVFDPFRLPTRCAVGGEFIRMIAPKVAQCSGALLTVATGPCRYPKFAGTPLRALNSIDDDGRPTHVKSKKQYLVFSFGYPRCFLIGVGHGYLYSGFGFILNPNWRVRVYFVVRVTSSCPLLRILVYRMCPSSIRDVCCI